MDPTQPHLSQDQPRPSVTTAGRFSMDIDTQFAQQDYQNQWGSSNESSLSEHNTSNDPTVPISQSGNITAQSMPAMLGPRAFHYTRGPPSPPHFSVPHVANMKQQVLPAYAGVGGEQIGEEDLKTITQITHIQFEQASNWEYESRRNAQLIVPFLYLGPALSAKNKEFLIREEITMLLAIRDTKTAMAQLLSGDKVAKELNIASASIDVAGNQELIAAFPQAVKAINDHLLTVYRLQTVQATGASNGGVTVPQAFKKGKVLVFCESGNERSACVVMAYLIAMFQFTVNGAMAFAMSQRFCIAIDDDMIQLLSSFSDIIQARRMVAQADNSNRDVQPGGISLVKSKRGLEETIDDEDDDMEDIDRFQDRDEHQPFISDGTSLHFN